MKRAIIVFFLIMLGSIAIFGQRDYNDFPKEKRDRDLDCYDLRSREAFDRCVEKKLPICPKIRDIRDKVIDRDYRDFPCREEKEEKQLPICPRWYIEGLGPERRFEDFRCRMPKERYPADKSDTPRDYKSKNKEEEFISRQLPNEQPESFEVFSAAFAET